MYTHNQPPLFFYLVALTSVFFGYGEIPMHLLISIFTFFALLIFYNLTVLLNIKNTNTLILLLAFSPAFIVNQNLMTDIPVLTILLGFAFYLLKANLTGKNHFYILAALLLGIGMLIKYSFLPLIVLLTIVIILNKAYKKLLVLLIPIGIIIAWSIWNYLEFGSIHMFGRANSIHIVKLWAFPGCIGAVTFFSISLLYANYKTSVVKPIIYATLSIVMLAIVLFITNIVDEVFFSQFISVYFTINGTFMCYAIASRFFSSFKLSTTLNSKPSSDLILFLFIGALMSFIILFAPFIATRHILLILPFALLFSAKQISIAPRTVNLSVISLTIILGILIGISDWKYADYYREMASEIKLPKDKKVWTAGHWGWQWYSKQNGMIEYSTNQSELNVGDLIVYPGGVSIQEFNKNTKLSVIEKVWDEPTLLTFVSGNNQASMYSSYLNKVPWTLSKSPIDTIFICEVESIGKNTTTTN
jgi:4-amino-4-deoxy-L-arabinose transferase-like glycosyltransferase